MDVNLVKQPRILNIYDASDCKENKSIMVVLENDSNIQGK